MKASILRHDEFTAYEQLVRDIFDIWRNAHEPLLRGLNARDLPSTTIDRLSEELLACFADLPLLCRYAVYQRLMDYWDDAMQDDVYLIVSDGWLKAARPRRTIEDKNRKIKEIPDLTVERRKYKTDLIPPALIAARYFSAEQTNFETLSVHHETAARELDDFKEEHLSFHRGGESGLLSDAVNHKGKVTKRAVQDRINTIAYEPENRAELDVLQRCLTLIDAETTAAQAVNEAKAVLDAAILAHYALLTDVEIKTLVVEDKWFNSIRASISSEVQRITLLLAGRIQELEERYAQPLPELERETAAVGAKVKRHLKRMGISL